ncbi:MAG: dsDNA nuclease domain-containing protein, partial [Sulfurimonas sp.]|nr:dsDNA nuclease domain-containing protein [Sulfurimonas sp.]
MTNNINPLYTEQREIKGAETHGKYLYQYNWALYRAFQKQENAEEYAIFVELQEDVVLSNSLNAENAQFEFNQVKEVQKKYTEKNITTIDKGKKNSILGKLLESSLNKKFIDKIEKISLVSTGGFNIPLKQDKTSLNYIALEDIDFSCLEHFSEKIQKELNLEFFPLNLYFLVPDMPSNGFQEFLIGYIATTVKRLFPHSYTSAEDIYLPLIDELNRKGIVTYDFKQWDRLLKEKALTSITVTKVINEFTNRKQDEKVYQELESYFKD